MLAFMALGLSAMAQHVTPLAIEIAEVQIDTLRAQYFAEPTMYRAALNALAVDLKEESALKSMQKTIEKQQRKLNANRRLNKEARDNYSQMLEKQQKELGYALREVAERQHSVSDLETSIQNWQTLQQNYVQETVQKENELIRLETIYKQHSATLKNELKATKSMK